MEINREIITDLTSSIRISVNESDYAENVEKTLKKYQRDAKMPGFRPGKVPFGLIRKMYRRAAVADEINMLISKGLQDHITENELNLLGEPLPNATEQKPIDFETDTEFEFVFDIALQPTIDLELSKKIKADLHIVEISDKEVDEYLNDVLKRNGEVVEVEEATAGDYLRGEIIQIDGDGNPAEGGIQRENALLAIDYLQSDEAKERFIGSKISDTVTFNTARDIVNEAEIASLLGIDRNMAAGHDADFSYTINSISRMAPALINEDLYAKVFPNEEISSEEALRERIREDISKSYQHESESLFFYDAMDVLLDQLKIELPDEFMKRWILETSKEEISEEDAAEQWNVYAPMLRRQLVENKLMADNSIEYGQDEIRRQVMMRLGMPVGDDETEEQKQMAERLVSTVMQNEEQASRIREEIRRDKLAAVLKEQLKVNEKKVSVEDFITLVTEHNKR